MTADSSLLTPGSALDRLLHDVALESRCAVFCGIPGVGKSLLVRETLGHALAAGRQVTLLQWDVARQSFELPEILARYPEIDGATHGAIRRGVGLWVREALGDWAERHRAARDLLVVEAPLVGGRLIEVAERADDAAEALLAGNATSFIVPAPTRRVRAAIEAARRAEMQHHRHERDAANAQPHVVDALWIMVAATADALGIPADPVEGYSPERYVEVYRRVLQHRPVVVASVDEVFDVVESPHALTARAPDLTPSREQALRLIARVERDGLEALAQRLERWYLT